MTEKFSAVIFNQSSGLLFFLNTRSLESGVDAPQKFVEKRERRKGFEILQKSLEKLSNMRLLQHESLVAKNVLDICLHTFRSEKAFEECIEPICIVLQVRCSLFFSFFCDRTIGITYAARLTFMYLRRVSCFALQSYGAGVKKEGEDSGLEDDEEETRGSKMLNQKDGEDLFDAIAKSFYVGKKDIGVGIRRQKLRALGLISERFPDIMEGICTPVGNSRLISLINLLESSLKSSESDKKEQQVLTGCLEALRFALGRGEFVTLFVKKAGTLKSVYNCMYSALEELISGKLNRYHLPIAALHLFAVQTELFKDLMFVASESSNCVSLCKMLLEACRHQNKDVNSKALKAYEAFLGCARERLIGNRAALEQMCKLFQELLKSDARSRCLSLRGFGSFAAAIKSIESNDYLDKQWGQLAKYMESVLGQGEDVERDEVNLQLPALIIAFADIVLALDQVRSTRGSDCPCPFVCIYEKK